MARPRKISTVAEDKPAPIVAEAIDELQEQPAQPVVMTTPTAVQITVKPSSRWFSIQSGGVWFVKDQPATFNIGDPRLAEWRANSYLLVEEV